MGLKACAAAGLIVAASSNASASDFGERFVFPPTPRDAASWSGPNSIEISGFPFQAFSAPAQFAWKIADDTFLAWGVSFDPSGRGQASCTQPCSRPVTSRVRGVFGYSDSASSVYATAGLGLKSASAAGASFAATSPAVARWSFGLGASYFLTSNLVIFTELNSAGLQCQVFCLNSALNVTNSYDWRIGLTVPFDSGAYREHFSREGGGETWLEKVRRILFGTIPDYPGPK